MDLETLLKSPPKVHDWTPGSGVLTSSGLPEDVFRFMDQVLNSNMKSVETGLGISTALFAMRGCKHTCINPDVEETERLKNYCREMDISYSNVVFLPNTSDKVWFDLRGELWDFVLVDGCHGFPTPFIDWYFLSLGLKVGGYLLIDDTQLWTGQVLRDFLLTEDAWKLIPNLDAKTAVFQKVKEFDPNKEWIYQPFVIGLSNQTKPSRESFVVDFLRRIKRKLGRVLNN